jgi:hypothetical protein
VEGGEPNNQPESHYSSVNASLVRYWYERQISRSPSMTGSLSCLQQLLLVTDKKQSFLTYWNPLLDPVQGLARFWGKGRTTKSNRRERCEKGVVFYLIVECCRWRVVNRKINQNPNIPLSFSRLKPSSLPV